MRRINPYAPLDRPEVTTHYRTFNDPNSYKELDLAFRRMGTPEMLASQSNAELLISDYLYEPTNEMERRAIIESRKKRGVLDNNGDPLDFFPVGTRSFELNETLLRHAAMFHGMQDPDAEVVYSLTDMVAICAVIDPNVYSEILIWSQDVQNDTGDEGNSLGVDISALSVRQFANAGSTPNLPAE